MYTGLTLMNADELAEISRLIGVEHPPNSRDVLFDIVSGWLARTVKMEGRAQDEVERCVLERTAEHWRIIVPEGTNTNDLERSLRLKIAHDAVEFLAPGWALCCALIASGKRANIEQKLDMMEDAASTAVPSSRARAAKREEWSGWCSRWANLDPMPELEASILAIKERPELQSECLTLGLALSLLDGGIALPTEKLYKSICDELELSTTDAADIKKRVSDLYWKFHNAAQPSESGESHKALDPVHSAARQTVYGAGALEVLAAEARQELFSSVQPIGKRKSGWSKFVGGLSGMSPFFSNKMKDDTSAMLSRLVYHTILKQHDAVVVAAQKAHAKMLSVLASEPAPQEVGFKPVTPPPAPAPVQQVPEFVAPIDDKPVGLSDLMVEQSNKPMRKIQLDL